jgi:hypothetical protein
MLDHSSRRIEAIHAAGGSLSRKQFDGGAAHSSWANQANAMTAETVDMTDARAHPAVEYDDASHTYTVNGERFPSVTEICDLMQIWSMLREGYTWTVAREVMRAAAEFGQNVHEAAHLDNLGILDYDALDPQLKPYVDGWRKFLSDLKGIVVASEVIVVSMSHKYAGRLDAIVRIGKQLWLIDIKATALIPRTAGPQTAAYKHAHGDSKLRRRVVRLTGDGIGYESKILDEPTDFSNFDAALKMFRWFKS